MRSDAAVAVRRGNSVTRSAVSDSRAPHLQFIVRVALSRARQLYGLIDEGRLTCPDHAFGRRREDHPDGGNAEYATGRNDRHVQFRKLQQRVTENTALIDAKISDLVQGLTAGIRGTNALLEDDGGDGNRMHAQLSATQGQ